MEKPGRSIASTAEAASFVGDSIKAFVLESPENRHQRIDNTPIFDEPLVTFASSDDPLFSQYKKIIGDFHLTPQEVLASAPSAGRATGAISVISWVLPINRRARVSNRGRELTPSMRWAHTRTYGEKFNDRLRAHVVSVLTGMGYQAVAPILTPAYKTLEREDGLASTWSERHVAYAAGLGTFSLSDGFITPAGIAMRCGSVVTNLPLPASERKYKNHLANCLYYQDGSCGLCIDRCPAGAITAKGHDKKKCFAYLFRELEPLRKRYDAEVPGCGLCQTAVPCESRIPTSAPALE